MPAACLLLLVLAGCASDGPRRVQDMTISAPAVSSLLYPGCNGCRVQIVARMRPHGSRTESLRVLVTSREGTPMAVAPQVQVRSGAAVQAITTDGGTAVVWFGCPGPVDGTCIAMTVTVPPDAPCPYRVRLVPVFVAP